MRERDLHIDIDNLPEMQADDAEKTEVLDALEEDQSAQEGGETLTADWVVPPEDQQRPSTTAPSAAKGAKSSTAPAAWMALVLALLALAGMAYLNHLQTLALDDAVKRVQELESRLSSTDASVSKSGVEIQINLKELKDRTDELWTQMDKLWASAWRRNQTDINNHSKQLGSHDESIKAVTETAVAVETAVAEAKQDITVLRAELDEIFELSSQLDAANKEIAALKKANEKLKASSTNQSKQLKEHREWLQSNDAFRKQTNKALSALEQQVQKLGASGAATAP